jgi:hypothetical protein
MIFITKRMHQRGESGTKLAPIQRGRFVRLSLSHGFIYKKGPHLFGVQAFFNA